MLNSGGAVSPPITQDSAPEEAVHYKALVIGLVLGGLLLAIVISATIFHLVYRLSMARRKQPSSYTQSTYSTDSTITLVESRYTVLQTLQHWIRQCTKTRKQSSPPVYICKASYDYRIPNQTISSSEWLARPLISPRPVTPPLPTAIAGHRGPPNIISNAAGVQPAAALLEFSPCSYTRRNSGFSSITVFEEDTLPDSVSLKSPNM